MYSATIERGLGALLTPSFSYRAPSTASYMAVQVRGPAPLRVVRAIPYATHDQAVRAARTWANWGESVGFGIDDIAYVSFHRKVVGAWMHHPQGPKRIPAAGVQRMMEQFGVLRGLGEGEYEGEDFTVAWLPAWAGFAVGAGGLAIGWMFGRAMKK